MPDGIIGLFYFMGSYWMYILYSETGDRYYIGSSGDPEKRLRFHNSVKKGFTSRYRPWKLVFKKEYPSNGTAQDAERKIES